MPYGKFKSVVEVARKFDIEVKTGSFMKKIEIKIPDFPFSDIKAQLIDEANYINEVTICEAVIRPILKEVAAQYEPLRIWSHVPYNVDEEKGLVGEPDYLIAPRTKYGDMDIPPLCVIEAKQEKFDEGWAQALAEMLATSFQGAYICYGVVTTGKSWEFGKLEDKLFTKDPGQISATRELQEVFDLLNWLFDRANTLIENKEAEVKV
ncbi:MAG: hypothetical protein GY862_08435 [Gammaproteobacteria bacterium]|nr:hypothetical protein [Gammaproteobacteria bacterium]